MELHAYSQWDYWQKKPITVVRGIISLQFVKTKQSGPIIDPNANLNCDW